MKLQNLIIIFIIIIIPVIFIFSYYLGLQIDTINLQTDYDHKLIEATKEAIEAFEINTIEWNGEYSTLANSKRRDIMASINVFTSGLANKLGIGGTAREYILDYIPAIVYIMYDGYYIYTPTYVPETVTNENGIQLFYYKDASNNFKIMPNATQVVGGKTTEGEIMYKAETGAQTVNGITFTTNINNAKKTYKHVLKTFVPYSSTYNYNGKNYVINYTLDNYVRVIDNDESKEGYISNYQSIINRLGTNNNNIYQNLNELISENIAVRDSETQSVRVENYPYVYNSNNDKRYYDAAADKFFIVNNKYVKVYLPEVEPNHQLAEFKKLFMISNLYREENIELYHLLNKHENKLYYIDQQGHYQEIEYINQDLIYNGFKYDYSAINYYTEAYCFNKWLQSTFGTDYEKILDNKNQSIINNINNNLKLSMANYSANSSIDYKLPEITNADWEQALSNISIITFFQGAKIGLKTYNNYVVVTSNENNEVVNEDSLYYYSNTYRDAYYHRYGCNHNVGEVDAAYLRTDYKAQSYTVGDNAYAYYKHWNDSNPLMPCFYCIINANKMEEYGDLGFDLTKEVALARERYIKQSRTRLFKD